MFLAKPVWVNLLALVPIVSYLSWRRRKLSFERRTLIVSAVFGVAFGFVEASVVLYLRAATGLLPGFKGALPDALGYSGHFPQVAQTLGSLPDTLVHLEKFREAATLIMLVSVVLLLNPKSVERFALFLWIFAIWDIGYYFSLWATTRWPPGLSEPDVLFLIPVPWVSQVWFPLTISGLTLAAVIFARKPIGN